jgi:hypothetical protein
MLKWVRQFYYFLAMHEISIETFIGNFTTCTVSLAGGQSEK